MAEAYNKSKAGALAAVESEKKRMEKSPSNLKGGFLLRASQTSRTKTSTPEPPTASSSSSPASTPTGTTISPGSKPLRGPLDLQIVGNSSSSSSTKGGSSSGSTPSSGGSKGMVMPEVQSAMEGGGSSAAAKMASKLSSGSWITPDLMQRIASEPILLAGMQQPKCMEALGELQRNPAAAKAKYAGDPSITRFLTTFAGLLGEHFSQLGEAEKKAGGSGGGSNTPSSPAAPTAAAANTPSPGASGGGGIGLTPVSTKPSPAKAVASIAKAASEGALPAGTDAEVTKALSNPQVVELLSDPETQRMMKECAEVPGALRRYMGEEKSRGKLLLMEKLGLISFR
jgi:hypothetical protein